MGHRPLRRLPTLQVLLAEPVPVPGGGRCVVGGPVAFDRQDHLARPGRVLGGVVLAATGQAVEIRRRLPAARASWVQNITATASGATAQGAMFGNVINYGDAPRPGASTARQGTDSRDQEERDDQP